MASVEAAARRNVACPSCGAPVRFRGATSIVAVCPYCKSTLVREGVELANVGRQAELLEDHSPIRIGTEGRHRGLGFTVVGRIQYRYAAGAWNEWYVLFRGSKGAWLSDASREYTIAYLVPPQPVPAFEELAPGQTLRLGGEAAFAGEYTVTNLESAEVVAGEGELPWRFESGWKAPVADLRGEGASFATIDYSDTPPHIYVGEKLPFDTFGFAGLRDPEQAGGFTKGTAAAFKCTGCGAPIEKHLATTEVIACGSCGTVSDVTGATAQLVQKNERNMRKSAPAVPLGAVGSWKGVRYEIVGYLRRTVTVDGIDYAWGEHLLHNVERGYAWLTEYDGHFNFVQAAAELPKTGKMLAGGKISRVYLGRTFAHFQRAEARVSHLAGEFYWRVKLGDEATCDDYVAPPLVLSSEKTGSEITWSLGEYVEPAAVWQAFGLKTKPPKPRGVAANQPSPYQGRVKRYWLAFAGFVVLALAAQATFHLLRPAPRTTQLTFAAAAGEAARAVSPVFALGAAGGPVTVRTRSNAVSDWLDLSMQLTEVDSGRAWRLERQLGNRRLRGAGPDLGGEDVAEIRGVPAGRYTLAVESRSPRPVRGTIDLYRAPVGWSNFWLFAGFLALFPVVASLRAHAFERSRWSESDYPPAGMDSDSDSDSDDD